MDHRVHVRLDTPAEAEAFDELLWTFADRSFVPHDLASAGGPAPAAPVVIGHGAGPPGPGDLLVNLGAGVPPDFDRYARVAEFVDADEIRRQLGRERFRYYRERGLVPESHAVGAAP